MHNIYRVFTIDKCIRNYLMDHFFYEESNRYYADRANISRTIIRKIRRTIGYNINDFAKIYQGITLEEIATAELKIDKRDYFRS